jgi:hypothetical protein
MPRKKKIVTSVTKESLIKLKKNELISMAQKEKIVLPKKYTKLIIINLLLQKNDKLKTKTTKSANKSANKTTNKTTDDINVTKKKKRGRRAKN